MIRSLLYVRKFVAIDIDSSTWTPNSPPSQLSKWHGKSKKLSVGAALLHTALRTRPPTSTGIDLADYWAWLRYGPAIDSDRRLGLRDAWDLIDPHQKNILSDDFGMGFTTYFLSQTLKFKSFADTIHFVKVAHPGGYEFVHVSKKNGSFKSPDFVAMDSSTYSSKISVVECKGTQSSVTQLVKALEHGHEQKENLIATAGVGSKIDQKLVAGLFIPMRSRGSALIRVRDPEYLQVAKAFEEIPSDRLEPAVVQVDLAKHFALMGLHSVANTLVTTNTSERNTLERVFEAEVRTLQSSNPEELTFRTEYLLPMDVAKVADIHVRRAMFTMSCPVVLYNSLVETQDLQGALQSIVGSAKRREWKETFENDGLRTILHSPLGFRLELEYLPQ